MNDSISQVFAILFWAFIVYLVYIYIRKGKKFSYGVPRKRLSPSERIGKIGESAVSSVLTEYCRRSGAHYFDNITLPFDDGTTQIDHVLVTKKGVLVIETKNWAGSIYAKAEDQKWTQVLSSGKNIFQNPIRQNYKHWLAICSLLDFLPQHCIQEVVVFTGNAKFKTGIPDGVLFIDELEEFLDLFDFGTLSNDDIHRSVGRIECNRLERSEQTDLDHRDYLNRTFGNSPIHMDGEYIRRKRYYRYRNW